MNIEVCQAFSLSQGTAGFQDRADCVLAIFGEAFAPVVHDGVEVIRDLEQVDILMTVFVEVVFFV